MSWRGGENQIRLLIEGLQGDPQFRCFAAYPKGSKGLERLSRLVPSYGFLPRQALPLLGHPGLVQYCREQQIDIIDCHSSGAQSLALAVKKKLPRIHIVVHRRVPHTSKENFVTKKKYLSHNIAVYVPISELIKKTLTEFGVPEEKVIPVLSAVDIEPYRKLDKAQRLDEVRRAHGIPEDTVIIGNAAALSPEKGHDDLLKALRSLKDQGVKYHCLIAGTGPAEEDLKKLCGELKLQDDVTFMGFLKDVPHFLMGVEVFGFPSTFEGLGTALLEAGYAQTCIVATREGGIPEIVKDGETGLLVERFSPQDLAEKLKRVLEDRELRQRFAKRIHSHIEEVFSLENMVNGNRRVYQRVLQGEFL